MDFLARGYSALKGDHGQHQSADETIERLVDALETATLPGDRRASILSLKGLVDDYTEIVGDKSLPSLIRGLRNDHKDIESTKAILIILHALCSQDHKPSHQALRFTDKLLEDVENVAILLDVLEEYEFYTRYEAVKLLSVLLENRSKQIQDCVLGRPLGVARLVNLLDDRREIIRNEGLLLLINLTQSTAEGQSNSEIQKMITFHETFEKLLAIIAGEEGISGDIIVRDSLTLMCNLLRYNDQNQKYFRETGCIQQLPDLLGYVGDRNEDHIPLSNEDWPPQKIANTVLVLCLIQILTTPDGTNTDVNQKVLNDCGILLPIVQLAVCSNAPTEVRVEALRALACVIRSNISIQSTLARTTVACPRVIIDGVIDPNAGLIPPRPALLSLLTIVVMADPGVEYSNSVRFAAMDTVIAALENNDEAKIVIASTMQIPPEDNINSLYPDKPHSAGSLLREYIENWELSSADPSKLWFACNILSAIIKDNEKAKKVVGGIVFGDESKGEEPVTLLHHIVSQLKMASHTPGTPPRIPTAYLCLLCVWLFNSPESVSSFLSESTHIHFSLWNIISPRIGVINSNLQRLKESRSVRNIEDPQIMEDNDIQLPLLDKSFVFFFKDIYETIQKSLRTNPKAFQKQSSAVGAVVDEDIQIYKTKLHAMSEKMSDMESQNVTLNKMVNDLRAQIATLSIPSDAKGQDEKKEVETLRLQLETLRQENSALALKQSTAMNENTVLQNKLHDLEKEHENLLVYLDEQDKTIQKHKDRLKNLGHEVSDNEEDAE